MITHNIELQKQSIEYINETLGQYEEVEYSTSRIINNPIVHMYPTEDTYEANGTLNGFIDALLVTMKIYDTKSMTVMTIKNRDELSLFGIDGISSVRVFKDGSTMIIMRGQYKFGNCQSVSVYKVE